MSKTITLSEAKRAFSRCIREVEAGDEFVVTRRGRPIALIAPVRRKRVMTAEQKAALSRLDAAMKKGWDLGIEFPLDRDALHERR